MSRLARPVLLRVEPARARGCEPERPARSVATGHGGVVARADRRRSRGRSRGSTPTSSSRECRRRSRTASSTTSTGSRRRPRASRSTLSRRRCPSEPSSASWAGGSSRACSRETPRRSRRWSRSWRRRPAKASRHRPSARAWASSPSCRSRTASPTARWRSRWSAAANMPASGWPRRRRARCRRAGSPRRSSSAPRVRPPAGRRWATRTRCASSSATRYV